MLLAAVTSRIGERLARLDAVPRALPGAEYRFLLGRFVDAATLARADALARRWGVHPHDVLIATGWLDGEDYCRALAEHCGILFRTALPPSAVVPPETANPRQCLANGLLKERTRARSYVLAPGRLRPNALRTMLARLSPHAFTFASPRSVRAAIRRHFAASLAHGAVEGLASRRPGMSARTRPAWWQRLGFALGTAALLGAVAFAPVETIRIVTLALALLFVPVIALRLIAAHDLLTRKEEESASPRLPDHALPIYTLLVPLFREAHMLPRLIHELTHLDWPALGSKGPLLPNAATGRH